MAIIAEYIEAARRGTNPRVICRMSSGWAVMGEVQFLEGYCVLMADPVVATLNDLHEQARADFLTDMARIGDAVTQVTRADRINYEILGNVVHELHAHVFPRFDNEPREKRSAPVWFYDWASAPPFSEEKHGAMRDKIREAIAQLSCNK